MGYRLPGGATEECLPYHPVIANSNSDNAHPWPGAQESKIACAFFTCLCMANGIYSLPCQNYSNASQSWAAVSTCIRKWADSAFLRVRYANLKRYLEINTYDTVKNTDAPFSLKLIWRCCIEVM